MKNKPKKQQHGAAHLALVIAVVVILAGATGFAGYNTWQRQQANAGGEDTIGTEIASLKVASYNILGSGALAAPKFNAAHQTNNRQRTQDTAQLLNDNAIDIVGIQEINKEENQDGLFKLAMNKNGYVRYPKDTSASDNSWMRPIYWKNNRFTLLESGVMKYPWQDAPFLRANDGGPWVLLEDSLSGKSYLILNVHLVAYNNNSCRFRCNPPGTRGGSDAGGAEKRKRAAQLVNQWVRKKGGKSANVIVTGDMNSAMNRRVGKDFNIQYDAAVRRDELPYCVFSSESLQHAYDAYSGNTGQCPSRLPLGTRAGQDPIDHIYVTPALEVLSAPRSISGSLASRASDHRARVIEVRSRQ